MCASGKSRELPARWAQGRCCTTTSFRKPISQLVDSDTVDPGWDGELMDNAFVFARREHHVHEVPVTATPQQRDLQGFEFHCRQRPGKCHGDTRTQSKVDGRAPMAAVARQHVSAAIKADQPSCQPYRSECRANSEVGEADTDPEEEVVSEGECRDNAPINTPQHSPT